MKVASYNKNKENSYPLKFKLNGSQVSSFLLTEASFVHFYVFFISRGGGVWIKSPGQG